MKLLLVTPLYPPDIGGPATRTVLLEKALPGKGIAVETLAFSSIKKHSFILGRFIFMWKIFRAALRSDLVYVLDPVSVGFPTMIACTFAFRPYVLSVVGDYAWEQGVQRFGVTGTLDEFVNTPLGKKRFPVRILCFVEHMVARHARRIIVPSAYLKRIITLWGVDPAHLRIVYNAFHVDDLPTDKRPDLRRQLGLYGTVLFSAGRLVPWKGFRTLIHLMPEIVAVVPEAILYIAGEGPDKEELERIISSRGLEHKVKLLGALPHKELMARIAAADMFVLNTNYEGFSHQLLEVMACGTPIVTTAVGGNPELVEDGRTGFLVRYDDTQALRSGILALYENKDLAWAISARAQDLSHRFTEEKMITETIAVFSEVRPLHAVSSGLVSEKDNDQKAAV